MMNDQWDGSRQSKHKNENVLGMAYVPDQEWREVYQADYGFSRGTIFAELDKPWLVGGTCYG